MVHPVVLCARVMLAGSLMAIPPINGLTQAQPPPASASAAKAKELMSLMAAKKLEAFAIREPDTTDRFIAVMSVPNVQLLLVTATYSRPTDIEYYVYQKEFVNAYRNLKSGALATDRFFVEDVLGDGLVAVPVKNGLPDSVTVDAKAQLLDGPADPKKRGDTRMAADAYGKAFADFDQRYAKALDALLAELKKSGTLVGSGHLR
jgi:hypothetical protein